jgi:hypothetical protein
MSGIVTAYVTTTLTIDVDLIGAAGTEADWNIALTGEKGDQGPVGGFGALAATKGNIPVGDGSTFGTFTVGADGTMAVADSTATYGVAYKAITAILAGAVDPTTDVASAATCDIGAALTDNVNITGTTTITSFGTQPDRIRFVSFAGALKLTYNGTSLILPGLGDITTLAGDTAVFRSNALGQWRCICYQRVSGNRQILTGNLTYYVRTDGSNSNNGLANTAGGAFLTIQKALDTAALLDTNGYVVTVQIADGTYTEALVVPQLLGKKTSASLVIRGNSGTPANVIVTQAGSFIPTFTVSNGAACTLQDMEIRATNNGYGIFADNGGDVAIGNLRFGACGSSHMYCRRSAIRASSAYVIAGDAGQHFDVAIGGVINCNSLAITQSAARAFTTFALCDQGALFSFSSTFAGTYTGTRYLARNFGLIQTFGGGANYFPGNVAGSAATGSYQ